MRAMICCVLACAFLGSLVSAEPFVNRLNNEEYANCELAPSLTATNAGKIYVLGVASDQNLYFTHQEISTTPAAQTLIGEYATVEGGGHDHHAASSSSSASGHGSSSSGGHGSSSTSSGGHGSSSSSSGAHGSTHGDAHVDAHSSKPASSSGAAAAGGAKRKPRQAVQDVPMTRFGLKTAWNEDSEAEGLGDAEKDAPRSSVIKPVEPSLYAALFRPWGSLGGPLASKASMAKNADGRVAIAMRGQDRKIYVKQQNRGSGGNAVGTGWTGWHGIDVHSTSEPLIRLNSQNCLEIYYRDRNGVIKVAYQEEPNADAYADWVDVVKVTDNLKDMKLLGLTLPVFATTPEGVRAYFVNALGHIMEGFHDEKQRAFGSFTEDDTLTVKGTPSVSVAADGRTLLFARGALNNHLYYKYTTMAGSGTWSEWYDLGGQLLSSPQSLTLHDGRVQVFVLSFDGVVRERTTDWVRGWSSWVSLDLLSASSSDAVLQLHILSSPIALLDAFGYVHVYAIANGDRIMENIQGPGAKHWGGWRDIGAYQSQ